MYPIKILCYPNNTNNHYYTITLKQVVDCSVNFVNQTDSPKQYIEQNYISTIHKHKKYCST